jgi:Mg-chelatase subunit ChlD
MIGRIHTRLHDERGIAAVLTALSIIALCAMVGLAIDVGRLFVTKAELTRAADAAALAGVKELPNLDNAERQALFYLHQNEPTAAATISQVGQLRQIRVEASKTVNMTFLRLLGRGPVTVRATAIAGFGIIPVDVVLAIDATGSMGAPERGCTSGQNNRGCPIKEARDAANAFLNVLLTGSERTAETVVGVVPYRGCYNPPRTYTYCVPQSWIGGLTHDKTAVRAKINGISAQGGTGTNVCLGLYKAREVLTGPGHHTEETTLKFIVLLSDGDNVMNPNARGNGQPPSDCRPATNNSYLGTSCSSTEAPEADLDRKTYQLAQAIKAMGIEIYVVGLGVCGSAGSATCNPSAIGVGHDNTADRNLLKCIASSKPGTNDHYFETNDPTQLTTIFENIGREIAFRLVE